MTDPRLDALIAALEPLLDNADGNDVSCVRAAFRLGGWPQEWLDAEEHARIAWKAARASLTEPAQTKDETTKKEEDLTRLP